MSTRPFPQDLREPGVLQIEHMVRILGTDLIRDALINHTSRPEQYLAEGRLGLYRVDDYYLIGLEAMPLHAHERWLYLRHINAHSWYMIRQDLRSMARLPNITTHLGSTIYLAFGSRTPSDIPELEFAATYLAMRYFEPTLERIYMGNVLAQLYALPMAVEERHDLMYHYEAWVARNPDFTDMPRDLAWRMHGLGPLLEAQTMLTVPFPRA